MVGNKDILVAAIDLMLIFVMTLILCFFSIRFSTEKGLGDKSILPVQKAVINNEINGVSSLSDYYAVILNSKNIELVEFKDGNARMINEFRSLDSFLTVIKDNNKYVVYEEEENSYFSGIVRGLIKHDVSVYIASDIDV